jgi:SAM-dependent methyltransferase
MAGNADQIAYWNGAMGERWAQFHPDMDRNLADITKGLMRLANARPGENVLDVGCGAGETSQLFAKAVAPNGHVTGVDISAPMLAVARARNIADADFAQADAATRIFRPEYDLVVSRFGVMFFDDPAAAFANIRKALKPGGRLAFVCWRSPQENEWVTALARAAQPLLPPAQPPADPFAPGPFAFADLGRVEGILLKAGFRAPRLEKLNSHMNLGNSAEEAAAQMINIGPLSRALTDANADDALRAKVRLAVTPVLDGLRKNGLVSPGAACWLVSATA